jgi:hypothetical protein
MRRLRESLPCCIPAFMSHPVRPFPDRDERVQVSTAGGEAPLWLPRGEVL